jgi:hypothetical protein
MSLSSSEENEWRDIKVRLGEDYQILFYKSSMGRQITSENDTFSTVSPLHNRDKHGNFWAAKRLFERLWLATGEPFFKGAGPSVLQ